MTAPATTSALDALKQELREIVDIDRAINVLGWDQLTQMPPGGAEGRADSLATLQAIKHARFTNPRLGDLLQRARNEVSGLGPDADDYHLVRVTMRDYEQQVRVPDDLVADMTRTAALANAVWEVARRDSDYASFAPWLEKNIELSRRLADHLGYRDQPFDALVDQNEPGMTTDAVRVIFDELRPRLVDLVRRIQPQLDSVDDGPLHRFYDEAAQERLGRDVSSRFGYDFTRGRIDRTTHPFEIPFGRDDVRITTRYSTTFLPMALMGTMHETGHGTYEQGISPAIAHSPLGAGVSAGMHESQSRLWENYVGRSRSFWQFYYPTVQKAFPDALGTTDLDAFYRAINKVQPSLIRVEADEVTYCLHIMMRFELEIALFDGKISVKDAPDAWNSAMREYVGVTPANDAEGILQDVHWTAGFGGFQGYALGNIIAAQLWEAVHRAQPDLQAQIGEGHFGPLLEWLRTHIHQHGRKYDPPELIQKATGAPLSSDAYIRYLREKFGGIYSL